MSNSGLPQCAYICHYEDSCAQSLELHNLRAATRVKALMAAIQLLRDDACMLCQQRRKLEAQLSWRMAAWLRMLREHAERSPQCPAAAR